MKLRMNRWALVAVAALFVPTRCFAVSFDCSMAQSFREKSVCSNPEIGGLDDLLDSAYREAARTTEDEQGLVASQRQWIRDTDRCGTEDCIAEAYAERIGELMGDPEEGDTDNVEDSVDQPEPASNPVGIQDRHREEEAELNRQVEEEDRAALEADRSAAEAQRLGAAKTAEDAKAQAVAGRCQRCSETAHKR